MATHHNGQEENEMDLKDLFALVHRFFYGIIAVIFKAIDFLLKFWWAIILLAIIGYALGYFSRGPREYTSSIIVKTNYDSQAYAYNAIEQFYNKLKENNSDKFFEEIGLTKGSPEIVDITISPIIDVVELLSNVPNDRTMTAVIKEIEMEEDESIFASEQFYSNFDYHKLEVTVTSLQSAEAIRRVIDYINNQPQISRIATMSKANFIERIKLNNSSLKQIDDVVNVYTTTRDFESKKTQQSGVYINENSLNIQQLFITKKELTEENEELKNQLATMEGSIYVVSDIQFTKVGTFFNSKPFLYSVFSVIMFLALAFMRFTYVTLKRGVSRL